MCSGRGGAVPGRNRVLGTGSRFRWVPQEVLRGFDGFRPVPAFGRWFQGLNGFWQVPGSQGLRTGSGNWFRVSIGSEVRKVAMLSGEDVSNILAVGDTTYAYFFFVFLLWHDDKDYNNMALRCAVYLMAKLEIPGLPVDFATTSKKSAQRPKGPPAKALGILWNPNGPNGVEITQKIPPEGMRI